MGGKKKITEKKEGRPWPFVSILVLKNSPSDAEREKASQEGVGLLLLFNFSLLVQIERIRKEKGRAEKLANLYYPGWK